MFIDRDSANDAGQPPEANSAQSSPHEEPVKMTLTASRQAVERMILLLHNRSIIAGSEWSRPVVIKNSPEVISVASRMIGTN
ncbi:hypothetical protein H6F87_27330 [Cyanobacteria bacterium FACHB-502]|nr:hypothetical protein [Cyanobacteria bacterium FACHB-502]